MTREAGHRREVGTVYAAGLLQGFAFVLVPALGDVLQGAPFGLSAARYGALFLPATAGAIASALVAGRLAVRMGAGNVLRLGLACNVAAAFLLAASVAVAGSGAAFVMLLTETALLGFGFGLNLAVANQLAAALFPGHDVTAVTVLNAVIGGATAVSPLLLAIARAMGGWWLWPAAIGLGFLLLLVLPRIDRGARGGSRGLRATATQLPVVFASAVLLYAIAEGSFGSWISVYADERGFPPHVGAWALAAFWGAMTLFRVLLGAATGRWLSPRRLYLLSPVAIGACFLGVAAVSAPAGLVFAFACAGAACSIYYPFTMSFALERFPGARTGTAGVLVAALMAGEGIGSWLPGPLQQWFDLAGIYAWFALWAVPLLWLAVRLARARGPEPAP